MKNRSTSPSTSRLDALSRDDRQRPRLKITCCYVPETHDPHGGAPLGIEDAVACLVDPMGEPRDGVTVCGGEPFAQVQELVRLLERLKSLKIHTVVYSGYTLEALANRSEPEVRSALTLMDVLIDGPFVAVLFTKFNGSGIFTVTAGSQTYSIDARSIGPPTPSTSTAVSAVSVA